MAMTGTTHQHQPLEGGRWNLRRWSEGALASIKRVNTSTLVILGTLFGLHLLTALLFMFGSASGEAAAWDRLPSDESWIRMTYIRNFTDSFAFQFSQGEASTGVTSPLWIIINGLFAAVFGVSDGALSGISKILGVLFGILSAWMVYRITWQITRKRYFGVAAGAVLAVEPHFGFAAVSGTEVTLLAALSLAASWAYLRGRTRTAGGFAALAILARPEGVLLALLILGSTLSRWMWRRDGELIQRRRDVQDVAWLTLPSIGIVALWVAYNWSITGNALPDSYLATTENLGLLPLSNLWNVWLGYLHELPFMDGLAWVVGLPLVLLGIFAVVRRHSFSAVPFAFFAFAMVYAATVTFTRPDSAWLFDDRRHMDVAVPFLVVLLAIGTARAWQLVWMWERVRKPQSDRERKAVYVTARVAAIALVVAPLAALPVRWDALTVEYSWTGRNSADVQIEMGRWLNENTPEDAVIGAVPSGAISFFAKREILDLSGKHTHDAQGTPPLTFGLEQEVDYLVAFREPFFDSIPGRAVVREQRVSFANPFQSNILRAYGPEGSDPVSESAREEFQLFDPTGLQLIDALDVGNGFADPEVSESTHAYGIEGDRAASSITMRTSSRSAVSDDFRSFSVAEEFISASRPGEALTIVKRYDATVSHSLRVFADGFEVGTWELPTERTFFGESAFTVPAEYVSRNRTSLRFEVIPGPNSIAGSSFFYWILVSG